MSEFLIPSLCVLLKCVMARFVLTCISLCYFVRRLVAGNKTRISDAEMEIRRKEDDLFERLKAPPNIDNALNNLTETLMDEREEPCEQKEEAMS